MQTTSILLGRDHPVGILRASIDQAIDGHGGLVLVTGEAGIGKTTLVSSAAGQARARGVLVLSATCSHSDNAPGYWPWVQILRGLRRGVGAEEWTSIDAAAGGRLSILL